MYYPLEITEDSTKKSSNESTYFWEDASKFNSFEQEDQEDSNVIDYNSILKNLKEELNKTKSEIKKLKRLGVLYEKVKNDVFEDFSDFDEDTNIENDSNDSNYYATVLKPLQDKLNYQSDLQNKIKQIELENKTLQHYSDLPDIGYWDYLPEQYKSNTQYYDIKETDEEKLEPIAKQFARESAYVANKYNTIRECLEYYKNNNSAEIRPICKQILYHYLDTTDYDTLKFVNSKLLAHDRFASSLFHTMLLQVWLQEVNNIYNDKNYMTIMGCNDDTLLKIFELYNCEMDNRGHRFNWQHYQDFLQWPGELSYFKKDKWHQYDEMVFMDCTFLQLIIRCPTDMCCQWVIDEIFVKNPSVFAVYPKSFGKQIGGYCVYDPKKGDPNQRFPWENSKGKFDLFFNKKKGWMIKTDALHTFFQYCNREKFSEWFQKCMLSADTNMFYCNLNQEKIDTFTLKVKGNCPKEWKKSLFTNSRLDFYFDAKETDNAGHAGGLVWDKKRRIVYRLEPHGRKNSENDNLYETFYSYDIMDEELQKEIQYFNEKFCKNDPFTLIPFTDLATATGVQSIEMKHSSKSLLELEGYCVAWVVWMMYMIIRYKDTYSGSLLSIFEQTFIHVNPKDYIYSFAIYLSFYYECFIKYLEYLITKTNIAAKTQNGKYKNSNLIIHKLKIFIQNMAKIFHNAQTVKIFHNPQKKSIDDKTFLEKFFMPLLDFKQMIEMDDWKISKFDTFNVELMQQPIIFDTKLIQKNLL